MPPAFISCLSGAGLYHSIIILTFVPNAFSIQTIRASVVRSPYRNPVRLPFIFFKLVRLELAARIILAGNSQCFWFFSVLLVQLQDDDFHPSIPSLFDRSICHSLRLWLLRLRSRLLCPSMCLLNGASQSWPALCLL